MKITSIEYDNGFLSNNGLEGLRQIYEIGAIGAVNAVLDENFF
jgi:hypothetical protein